MSEEEKKGFVIKDRRRFSDESGAEEDRGEGKEAPGDTGISEKTADRQREAAHQYQSAAESEAEAPLPEVNFSTFVFSLNASALLHLGMIEDPATGQKSKNLPMAKQTIDILSMLAEKTSGNLSQNEENLLKSMLYDLRIAYVKATS